MAHQAGQQWLDAPAAAVDNTSDAPVDTSDAIAAAAEPLFASPVVCAPPDTTIEQRNRKGTNKLKVRTSIVGGSPSVGAAPHAAAATVHSATLVHNIGGIDKGAMGAADYPVGGHDDLANVLQSPADSPPQPHAGHHRESRARAAEVHSRIEKAEAKVAQLRKELNDLRSHKADHREAILAGKVPPPTDVATAAAAPAPHVRGSIVAENKRIQAEKAAKAAGVGQDRL